MPFTQFFTGVRVLQHPLAYSPASNPLANIVHLRPGSENIWSPIGGTVDRRPGFRNLFGGPVAFPRHVEVSEDGALAMAALDPFSGAYKVFYREPGGSWAEIPNNRGVNESVDAPEMLWIRRKLYVKANPTTDKYGSVIFDLDEPSVTSWWGVQRPSSAPTFSAVSEWNDAATGVEIRPKYGARYAYTYVSSTGHESSSSPFTVRSPKENDKYPKLVFDAQADTTNIPFFNIYRTGDGGGALYLVKQIANPGTALTWSDDNFVEGGNFLSSLNTSRIAPGPTDNDPPPTVEEGTLGVDAIERSSPMVEYGGRILFAVGRNLYWSVNDEAVPGSGNLYETFRGGAILNPNRATFTERILDLQVTTEGVYVFTRKNTFLFTGLRRNEIRDRILFPEIGIKDRHCSVAVGGTVIWLDQNLNLRSTSGGIEARGTVPEILSTPLNGEQRVNPDHYFRVDAHHIPDYLFVSIFRAAQSAQGATMVTTAGDTTMFIYDALRKFWFSPWTLRASAIWKDMHVVATNNNVGQLDVDVFQDFSNSIDSQIITSGVLIVGESNLNVSDVDFVFQSVDAVELIWKGTDLTSQVRVGIDVLADESLVLNNLLPTNRSDPTARPPVGMKRGTFWLPDSEATGRYFNLAITPPADNLQWRLLNALFVFGSLGESRQTRD